MREAQREGDDAKVRRLALRLGLPLVPQVGDWVEVGPMYDYQGNVMKDTWCGQPCPTIAILISVVRWKLSPGHSWVAHPLPPIRSGNVLSSTRVLRVVRLAT